MAVEKITQRVLLSFSKLEKKIKQRMKEQKDYKAYYYRPISAIRQRKGRDARMDDMNMTGEIDDSV